MKRIMFVSEMRGTARIAAPSVLPFYLSFGFSVMKRKKDLTRHGWRRAVPATLSCLLLVELARLLCVGGVVDLSANVVPFLVICFAYLISASRLTRWPQTTVSAHRTWKILAPRKSEN
ncbi:hypothetical protein BDM02DRAFT_387667 [Thelephora ganbajun]|uniref:Uncharacterized protein n=1 Tax=Thelephora ganbajun TaxID=370292 RepID=A0ACB6Z866_THEGA|nr:hypothetical protein BDM02DRAFT_387667 [Thelephora ganbajun]